MKQSPPSVAGVSQTSQSTQEYSISLHRIKERAKSAMHPKHYISQPLLICTLRTKLWSIKSLTCKITKLLKI